MRQHFHAIVTQVQDGPSAVIFTQMQANIVSKSLHVKTNISAAVWAYLSA